MSDLWCCSVIVGVEMLPLDTPPPCSSGPVGYSLARGALVVTLRLMFVLEFVLDSFCHVVAFCGVLVVGREVAVFMSGFRFCTIFWGSLK